MVVYVQVVVLLIERVHIFQRTHQHQKRQTKKKIGTSKDINSCFVKPNGSNNLKTCFKCKGFGHFAADFPNRRIITLVEE